MLFPGYRYDVDGYFTEETMVQDNPKHPNDPSFALMPANCTLIQPPLKEGAWCKFVDGAWTYDEHPKTCAEAIERGMSCISNSPNKRQQEIKSILEKLVKADEEHYKTNVDENLVMTIEVIPEKTEEEKYNEAAEEVRRTRDQKLNETDYLLMPDYPISEEDKAKVEVYRQALRDITAQEGFPFNVEWPEYPL